MILFILNIIPLVIGYFYNNYNIIAIWSSFLIYVIINFLTICGVPLKKAMKMATNDEWLNQPYKIDAQKRYILFDFELKWFIMLPWINITVKKFNHGKQPIDSWLISKVPKNTIFNFWNMTFTNFLAICFSTFCNKPVYDKFNEFNKIQPYILNNIEKMYVAHIIWIMTNISNTDAILDDLVVSGIREEIFRDMKDESFIKMIETITLNNLFNGGYFTAYKRFYKNEKTKKNEIIQMNFKNDLSRAIQFL